VQGPVGLTKFATDVGTGSATGIQVSHNLGTEDVVWSMRDNGTKDYVLPSAYSVDSNNILFVFDTAPALNQYRAVIIA
jgi:hypothetical protein